MAQTTVEELRIRAALANPNMTSAEVRREAERVQSVLESIEFEDNARATFEAQAAEDERQQAINAQRRQEAVADAAGIVRKSHPEWGDDSVEREAHRLASENESAIAAMDLKAALADGIEPESYALGRR